MRWVLIWACFCGGLAISCGAAEGDAAHVTVNNVTTSLNVVFLPREPVRLPFDPRNARLPSATQQLTAIAGHPITYEFEAALLPEYEASFEEALIDAIENTARDLDTLKKQDPDAFALVEPRLKKISCAYDAIVTDSKSTFDEASETLRVRVPAHGRSFVPEWAARRALDDAFEGALEKRFANADGRGLSANDQRLYDRYLTRIMKVHTKPIETALDLASDPRSLQIARVLSFYPNVTDPELKAKLKKWIVDRGSFFVEAYVHHGNLVALVPPDSPFRRAESAWGAFVKSESFTDRDRRRVLEFLFTRPFTQNREPGHAYVSFSFPNVDKMAFADAVFDEWVKAHHPFDVVGDPDKTELFQFVACPYKPDERGDYSLSPRCDHDYYKFALESDANKSSLLKRVLATNERYVAANVIRSFIRTSGPEAVAARMYFWRGFEPNDALWSAATQVFAEEIGTTDDGSLQDEARRLYQSYPERRGTIAYLLASLDRYGNGKVPWATWAKNTGGSMGTHDFDRFLSHGGHAMALTAIMWPLLSPGFSRMDAIKPRLDGFLQDPNARFFRQRDPYLFLQDLQQKFCEEHDTADLEKLRAYLKTWTQNHPSDEKVYSTIIDDVDVCIRRGAPGPANDGVHSPPKPHGSPRMDHGF